MSWLRMDKIQPMLHSKPKANDLQWTAINIRVGVTLGTK